MSVAFFKSWPDIATGKYLVGVGVNGILGDVFAKTGVSDNPNCYIAAITPLDEADGTPVHSGNYASFTSSPTAISTACTNLEAAVRWLDYWYSDEGILLRNYGIEGYSFKYDDKGQPQYTDLIKNNPDVPVATAMQAFCFTSGPGYAYTIYETDDVKKGDDVWADFKPDWNMPSSISMTSDEASRYASIMADVNTFCEETVANMISGTISLDDYEKAFTDKLKSLNIDEAVSIQQAALDRYNAR
jgi:putative aldouronate transport system substrate-binding protein